MHTALLRRVSRSINDCQRTFIEPEPVDLERARHQHQAYAEALKRAGLSLQILPELATHADACFVEDPAHVLPEAAILLPMGTAARRGEVPSLRNALQEHRPVHEILRGRIEGGDILRHGKRIYVGASTRTNQTGFVEFASLVRRWGYTATAVPLRQCLHLKTACSLLDDESILLNPHFVDPAAFGGLRALTVDAREPLGANVLRLPGTGNVDDPEPLPRLLVSSKFKRTEAMLARTGYATWALDISEFERAEAGLTCLSLIF